MVKTRLRKFLEEIKDRDTKIKIGAKNGSGFFYVGTVGDFLDKSEKYEQADIIYFDNRVKRANENLEMMLNADTSFSGFAKKQYRKWENTSTRPNFSTDAYYLFLRGHAAQLLKKFQSYISERTIRSERTSLMSRVVTDHFIADKIVEPGNVMVIQIDGKESGQYWTTDEAETIPSIKFNGVIDGEINE